MRGRWIFSMALVVGTGSLVCAQGEKSLALDPDLPYQGKRSAPVTYQVGSKQFLAVQSSGRHLHPVKFDNLENSSYLFVFALN